MPRWRVLPGHSFDMGNGVTAEAGAEIELGDDVAAAHRHRVELVAEDAVQTPAQGAGDEFGSQEA